MVIDPGFPSRVFLTGGTYMTEFGGEGTFPPADGCVRQQILFDEEGEKEIYEEENFDRDSICDDERTACGLRNICGGERKLKD